MCLSYYAKYVNRKTRKRATFLEKGVALNGTHMTPSNLKNA